MKQLKIRKLFVDMNSSSKIELNKPIPKEYAIWDIDKTLALQNLFIINPDNLKYRKYLLARKIIFPILASIYIIKTIYLLFIDATLEENRYLIIILGYPTFVISGMR